MKDNTISFKGLSVWLICASFFLYEFLLRTVIGTFQHPIMYDLNLTTFKYTLLSSTTYLIIYGFMQIPVGIIVDNFGLKKSLFFASLCCAFSTFGFAFTYDFYYAVIFRMITGFGSAFGFICLLVSIYEWLPRSRSALFIGLSQFIGTLGPMVAAGPLDSIAEGSAVNWRYIFIYLAIMGIFLSLVILFFVDNNHNKTGKHTILYKPEPLYLTLKKLFKRSQPWVIAVFSALIYFSVEYFSENEGKNFLTEKGISSNNASYMITIAWLGYAIGCPLQGFISDYFQKRKPMLALSSLSCIVSLIGITFTLKGHLLVLSFFLIGFGAGGTSVCFALMAEQFKKNMVAVGLGLNNAMITVISAIYAPILGFLLEYHGNEVFDLYDYKFTFSFLIGLVSISTILVIFFIKESFCKSKATYTILNSN